MSHGEEKRSSRPVLQFGLRHLLLLMFVVASFFGGWTANELYRKRSADEVRVRIVQIKRPTVRSPGRMNSNYIKGFELPAEEKRQISPERNNQLFWKTK